MKTCGDCTYRDPARKICKLNLSYAAFVLPEQPANDCHGYHEVERATGEVQAQSECRPAILPAFAMWQQSMRKP